MAAACSGVCGSCAKGVAVHRRQSLPVPDAASAGMRRTAEDSHQPAEDHNPVPGAQAVAAHHRHDEGEYCDKFQTILPIIDSMHFMFQIPFTQFPLPACPPSPGVHGLGHGSAQPVQDQLPVGLDRRGANPGQLGGHRICPVVGPRFHWGRQPVNLRRRPLQLCALPVRPPGAGAPKLRGPVQQIRSVFGPGGWHWHSPLSNLSIPQAIWCLSGQTT
jgi:hypothetical protein